jgi:hypothetical protein
LKRLVPTTFFGEEKNEWSLVDGRKKESRSEGYSSFERMEVGGDSVRSFKS